jgi:hypothetical protein
MTSFNEWQPAGFDGQFHWDFLKGAFGPTISPMDLDAVVERNGRFLVFETKHSEEIVISYGQKRSLRALVKTGFFSVILLYGKTPETITSYTIWHGDQERIVSPANDIMVYEQCAEWYRYVNSLSAPDYPDQLRALYESLRQENSQLRAELAESQHRVLVLTDYLEKLEKQFQLGTTKAKPIKKQSMLLPLALLQ